MSTATHPTAPLSASSAARGSALDTLSSRLEVRGGVGLGLIAAFALHLAAGGAAAASVSLGELWSWQASVQNRLQSLILSEYEVDLTPLPEEKPEEVKEPEPEPEPVKEPEPEPEPAKAPEPPPDQTPPPAAARPAAAAAQAGRVLTQAPADDEPVNMTNSFVQGTGDTYAGGRTAATGTDTRAVRDANASAQGVIGGKGTAPAAPAAPAVDKSRVAGVSGSSEWDCPFPPEADALQEDLAYVTIRVSVGADGRAERVSILKDPGYGFGREARACAMQKRYNTALDAEGNPVAGDTKPIRVRFER